MASGVRHARAAGQRRTSEAGEPHQRERRISTVVVRQPHPVTDVRQSLPRHRQQRRGLCDDKRQRPCDRTHRAVSKQRVPRRVRIDGGQEPPGSWRVVGVRVGRIHAPERAADSVLDQQRCLPDCSGRPTLQGNRSVRPSARDGRGVDEHADGAGAVDEPAGEEAAARRPISPQRSAEPRRAVRLSRVRPRRCRRAADRGHARRHVSHGPRRLRPAFSVGRHDVHADIEFAARCELHVRTHESPLPRGGVDERPPRQGLARPAYHVVARSANVVHVHRSEHERIRLRVNTSACRAWTIGR